MKKRIYSIFDTKIEAYNTPFTSNTDKEVYRSLYNTVKQGNSTLADYPEDYTVFWIGTFDDTKAEIVSEGKIAIGSVLDIVIAMERQEKERNEKMRLANEKHNEA